MNLYNRKASSNATTASRVRCAQAAGACLMLCAFTVQAQQNVGAGTQTTTSVFATGSFILPEAVTAASANYGGGYLVSDADSHDVYHIAASGGAATVLSATGFRVFGTTQLSNYYGPLGGQILGVGTDAATLTMGIADLISNTGATTSLLSAAGSYFTSVTTATSNFGSIQAGQVLLTNETTGAIQVLGAHGTSLSTFTTIPGEAGQAFATGFAPSTFGPNAGDLFVSSETSGKLYVVNAQGQASLFANITLPSDTLSPGLRQMTWAPAGFGSYGGDMFLSVAAQNGGGGSLGEIEVLNSKGQEVALYNQGSAAKPLDPRGLLFTTINGETALLAANADPEIDLVSSKSFVQAPELDAGSGAAALTLLLGTLAVLQGRIRSKRP